ncbi:SAM-dependent methyltransferase [Prosthecobacter sp. SYSU 5D2]
MPDPVPFSAFMARALYDPERGYYARQIRTVGARGDFSTSATISPVFGQAVAGWLKQESVLQPKVRHIIEIGAGSGVLMERVQKSLGWWQRRRFQWHIVETSDVLQQRQRELLGAGVTWHKDLKAALEKTGGKAFLYHNELLDAFPVTLLQWHEEAWHEVHVTDEGREVWVPLARDEAQRAPFSALQNWPQKQPRQRVELHATAREWMQHWAPVWQVGAMLTVDYGDVFPALYYRRPGGTLRGYLHQQRLEGAEIYQNPGRQDLTSDVNFTDYRAWAEELGWQEVGYGTQAELIRKHVKNPPIDKGASFILTEEGAGGAFKYVVHRLSKEGHLHI